MMIIGRALTGPHHPAVAVDIAERTAATALFVNLCVRFYDFNVVHFDPTYLLIAISELCIVVFILVRRFAKDISLRYQDWAAAAFGTCLPLTAIPAAPSPIVSPFLCTCLILLGIAVQITSKLCLNRSFGLVPANRGVKTRGPYAFIRHPMYFGYSVTHIGFLLFAPSAVNLAIYVLAFAFQISRIFREERLLSHDPAYNEFAKTVRYRLVPGIF